MWQQRKSHSSHLFTLKHSKTFELTEENSVSIQSDSLVGNKSHLVQFFFKWLQLLFEVLVSALQSLDRFKIFADIIQVDSADLLTDPALQLIADLLENLNPATETTDLNRHIARRHLSLVDR